MTIPVSTNPAAALAALVAVFHRRTLQETFRIHSTSGDGERRRARVQIVDVSDDPGFATLAGRLASGPADDADANKSGPDANKGGTRADAAYDIMLQTRADGVPFAVEPRCGDLDRIAEQAAVALAAGRADPDRPLSALDVTPPADRDLVAAYGGHGVPAAAPRRIDALVEDRAAETPDAPAVTDGTTTLTYRELVDHAGAVAGELAEAGVRPEDVVGVLADRSPELIVALLAVLRAGGAYLALDPDLPDVRLRDLLTDASVGTVLVTPRFAPRVPRTIRAIPLSSPEHLVRRAGSVRPRTAARPDGLAYVSYTSGSTGRPKGVCVPHAAVSRLVRSPDWARFDSGDVFLQAAPVAFDASTLEIWAPLCNGGRLVVPPPGPLDLAELGRTVRDEGVTVLWLTAGLFHQMVDGHVEHLAGVRHLIAGGDVVAPEAVARLLAAHPHLVFTNGYGPTENTTFTTCGTVRGRLPDGPVPIGRPIGGTSVRVLDARLRPVGVGVVGELYAGGAGLARGYLGRPAATAGRFVPDPSGGPPGGRLYRTGDLVRWRPDGGLDFLGRADAQLKVNGYRVEPGEIETVLAGHPDVRSAAVVSQPRPDGGNRLVGYAVPAAPARETADGEAADGLGRRLLPWLRERLPPYLVPAWVDVVPELPLTRNGKVDRARLPEGRRIPRAVASDYVPPRTPMERFLCDLWGDVLGLDEIGVEDDFFELGGHSLVAAEVLARLEQEFGVELSARTLYLSPTVGELAEHATRDDFEPVDVEPADGATR
ncbi:amino acid adenylation domain-containing protein [Actinomadura sp. 9N215]|uniref:amino acid adenylation domain-containing protein n=1 Tax=Actinomadura sp. 9N215 TaxID=3375150 RepID=UPI0037A7BA9B